MAKKWKKLMKKTEKYNARVTRMGYDEKTGLFTSKTMCE